MIILEVDIENFGLFKHERLLFDSGLNVLTGESGSGKSLALESIATLFGSRFYSERLGVWGERTVLRAALALNAGDPQWQLLKECGVSSEEPTVVVERTFQRDGRSIYRIQGTLTPSTVVRQLGESFLQYVGQNQILRASSLSYVEDWVDHFGHLQELADAVRQRYQAWRQTVTRLEERQALSQELTLLDEKRQTLDELVHLNIQPGEEAQLAEDLARIRASRTLQETAQRLYGALDGGDQEPGLLARGAEVQRLLQMLVSYDRNLASTKEVLEGSLAALAEVRLDIAQWMQALEVDQGNLEILEERADVLSRVKRRFGPTLEDVLAYQGRLASDIEQLDNLEWELGEAKRAEEKARVALEEASRALSLARQEILPRASQELTDIIRQLEMPEGEICLWNEPQVVSERGMDKLSIGFSANPGQPLRPLGKVASGGELARVALALAVMNEDSTGDTVYLFDEIDQGLGGISAQKVGQLLQELGHRNQVIVVSHQPLVATRANVHLGVEKEGSDGMSMSRLTVLQGSDRVKEIARMLSGLPDDTALRHAAQLLREGSSTAGE